MVWVVYVLVTVAPVLKPIAIVWAHHYIAILLKTLSPIYDRILIGRFFLWPFFCSGYFYNTIGKSYSR